MPNKRPMNDESITYSCPGCHKTLSAPVEWIDRVVACPVCGHRAAVPAVGDIETQPPVPPVRNSGREAEILFVRTPTAPSVPPANPPRAGFFRRHKVAIITALVVAIAGGWWISWKWYYEHYVKAEAIMRNRGYGQRLERPPAPDPAIAGLVERVAGAEAASRERPDDLNTTMELISAYDAALNRIADIEAVRARVILNNAAWALSTTPHIGLRDPARALGLARTAVVQSCRKDAGYLDTLAEALFVNGLRDEAAETAREALKLNPQDPYLIERERHFALQAATPTATPIPIPIPTDTPAQTPAVKSE